ncbi:MAG: magnesium transporter [Gemmatimonadetes bacterium]|nr:magnesium transporter [Gemmatimonadota bacterium]
MVTAFTASGGLRLDRPLSDGAGSLQGATWIDMLDPSAEETRAVESALGIELPTRKDIEEIEISSRLYVENQTVFMTVTVMRRADTPQPGTTSVTFAYQSGRLLTLRFAEITPFTAFESKFRKTPAAFSTAQKVFMGVLDEIIDRVADILEFVGSDLNAVSAIIFADPNQHPVRKPTVDHTAVLTRIGRNGERAANARESLVSIGRLLGFVGEATPTVVGEALDEHWRTMRRDVSALSDHATFLSDKVNFFLDATLGSVNIEQNNIIKLFSVLAVVFLPPTLIASIYGMNFTYLPELRWVFGYPFSIVLMLVAAVLPYYLFKRRGWF